MHSGAVNDRERTGRDIERISGVRRSSEDVYQSATESVVGAAAELGHDADPSNSVECVDIVDIDGPVLTSAQESAADIMGTGSTEIIQNCTPSDVVTAEVDTEEVTSPLSSSSS